MADDEKSHFEQLKNAGEEYVRAKLELTKLQAFEKIAKVAGVFSSMLIVSLVACFTVVFIGLMLGFVLSDLFNSNAIGFSIIGVLFLAFFLVIAIKRKTLLEKPIVETVIRELFNDEDGDGLPDISDPDPHTKESNQE